jgi:hypothetical protein
MIVAPHRTASSAASEILASIESISASVEL